MQTSQILKLVFKVKMFVKKKHSHISSTLSPSCCVCVLILDGLSIILIQGEAPVTLLPIVPAIVLYLLYGILVPTPHGMLL